MNPPKMPVHIGDFLRDTGHLRAAGIGAYALLLFHHWSTGSLPDDDEQLMAIARLSKAEWAKLRPILAKFFDEGWRHGRVEKDLVEAKESYEKRAAAGAEGGKAKARNKQSSSSEVALPEPDASNALPTFNHLPKKDAADAAPDPDADLFRRGREVLGKGSGGLVAQLKTAKGGSIPHARAAIEQASTKDKPREYIARIISGPKTANEPNWLDGIPGVL